MDNQETEIGSRAERGRGPSFMVISGGTGGNAICTAFQDATYVLPVSDDGGSSSEIERVLGGPSIGDIRSRLVRLIPPSPPGSPLDAIRKLLSYRLPAYSPERQVREEWRQIVEGKSALWTDIPSDRKECIRGFLVYFENQLLIRAHKNFSYCNGSIGNYFLAAAQSFFRSLPSAIFLFATITKSQAFILPVIVTTNTVVVAAQLDNGEKLVGQCEISHPIRLPNTTSSSISNLAGSPDPFSPVEDDGMIFGFSRRQNVTFESEDDSFTPLPARISRLHYSNAYGQELYPMPNPTFISSLSTMDILVYSCGSLWTSIMPCLALHGVGTAIACSTSLRAKVLLLNSTNDRETEGYTAIDYIEAITRTLNTTYEARPNPGATRTVYPASAFITHLIYLQPSEVPVDVERIATMLGVKCIPVAATNSPSGVMTTPMFDAAYARCGLEALYHDLGARLDGNIIS